MATPERLLNPSRREEDSKTTIQKIFAKAVKWEGVKIGHYRLGPGQIPTRTRRTSEVFVPFAGSILLEGREPSGTTALRRRTVGEISVSPAGSTYSAQWEEEFEYFSVNFKDEYLKQATIDFEANRNAQIVLHCGPRDPLVRSIAQALAEELDSGQPAGKLYAESLVNALAVHLMRHYSTDALVPDLQFGGLPLGKLRRVTEFVEENLDQDLELTALAQVAELSPYHFARAFKQSVGVPPIQYLMERRIEHAKQLLADSRRSLAEIALSVGFKNQSHFTTLFRKYTEMTPRAWRNSHAR